MTVNANLLWAGALHITRADGSEFDGLEIGIGTANNATMGDLSATVTGPNGFSYSFTDSNAHAYAPSQLSLWVQYDQLSPLAPGPYTFIVTDSLGHSVSQTNLHVAPRSLPQMMVDNGVTQLLQWQRLADHSYRFNWPAVDAVSTYSYRFRIYDGPSAEVPIFSGNPQAKTWAAIPAGLLQDGVTYYAVVETLDSPSQELLHNRRDSARLAFVPQIIDYNPLQVLVDNTRAMNLKLADGSRQTALNIDVSDESAVTLAEVDGPNGFHYGFDLAGDYNGSDLSKTFDPATTPSGLYTFHIQANGLDDYRYDYLTSPADYPVPDASTLQVEDLGDGNLRFSWAPIEQPVPLWYRVWLSNPGTGAVYTSAWDATASCDLPQSTLDAALGAGSWEWTVEVADSGDWTSIRNLVTGPAVAFAPIPYDASRPLLTPFVSHRVSGTGQDQSVFFGRLADAENDVTQLAVTGPAGSGIDFDLLQQGNFYQGASASGYRFSTSGLPAPGLYTFVATDASGKQATRYDYQSPAVAYDPIDAGTLHVDTLADGQLRVSWAPVAAEVPLYYQVQFLTLADHNGDGFVDEALLSPYQAANSWTFSPGQLPNEPLVLRLRARETAAGTIWNNRIHSIYLGYEGSGFDYSTLVDQDQDGWASNVDPDDTDASVYPLSSPVQPPLAPTLVGPSGSVTTATPGYLWSAAAGAQSYDLYTKVNGTPTTVTYSATDLGCVSGTGQCSVTPATVLPNGAYVYWVVRARNAAGVSPWSGNLTMSIETLPDPPVLIGPTGSIGTTRPAYSWNAALGATSYDLYTKVDGTPTTVNYSAVAAGCGDGTCAITPADSLPSGAGVYWIVRAKNAAGVSGWSSNLSFTVQNIPTAPSSLAPSGYITGTSPSYNWSAVAGAESYELYTKINGIPTSVSYTATDAGCAAGTGTCDVTPATVLANGTAVYWLVRAKNAAGVSPWSTNKNFVVQILPGTPTPVAPSGYITDTSPSYSWSAVTGAASYDLYTKVNGTPTTVTYSAGDAGCAAGTGTCGIAPGTVLANGSAVYWLVRARNAAGVSPWSTNKTFTVQLLPATPTALAPSGTASTTPNYSWTAAVNATSYDLYLRVNGVPSTVNVSAAAAGCASGTGTCSASAGGLTSGDGVYWLVRGRNAAGVSPWSAPLSFGAN